MNKKTAKDVHELLEGYIKWCDQVIDYNYDPPKYVNTKLGELYEVSGDVNKVRRREEPNLRGFMDYVKLMSY